MLYFLRTLDEHQVRSNFCMSFSFQDFPQFIGAQHVPGNLTLTNVGQIC